MMRGRNRDGDGKREEAKTAANWSPGVSELNRNSARKLGAEPKTPDANLFLWWINGKDYLKNITNYTKLSIAMAIYLNTYKVSVSHFNGAPFP
jgi:hypothetical protein